MFHQHVPPCMDTLRKLLRMLEKGWVDCDKWERPPIVKYLTLLSKNQELRQVTQHSSLVSGGCKNMTRWLHRTLFTAWSVGAAERKRLNKLVKKTGSVLDCSLDPVEVVGDRRMTVKLSSIMDNVSHPLHETVSALESSISNWLLHTRCTKERQVLPPLCCQTLPSAAPSK